MSINEKVEKLPDQFWDLIELQGLDLSDCWLTELSSGIGQLTQLKYLDLSGNLLTGLPPEIGTLTSLETSSCPGIS